MYGVKIVVSESVHDALGGDDFYFQYLDNVKVFGKNKSIKIYTVMHKQHAEKMMAELDAYDHAMKLYQSMHFEAALTEFQELFGMRPDSMLYKLYISRTEQLIAKPPTGDWSDCFVFLNK
jgi:predicted Zn-dependent protease